MNKRKIEILLVEDETAHVELIRWAFEFRSDWANLTIASNLSQARSLMQTFVPDLVLTDLLLPDGKGTDLLPDHHALPLYPVVIMTGYGDEHIAVEAIKAGALDYVVKSEATMTDIPRIVERALREWEHIIGRRQAERALQDSRQVMQDFLDLLKSLHNLSIVLAKTDSFDDLCRQAVELGRSRLGFDRLSIWLIDEDAKFRLGTFGTDELGQTRDERAVRLLNDALFAQVLRQPSSDEILEDHVPIIFEADIDLPDNDGQVIGHGWLAIAALWDGSRVVGCIAADNLLNQQPLPNYQLELLMLYRTTLGHLMTRKLAEEQVQASLREKELLLKEIHHRVKNNLQVVSSLLDLQSNYVQYAETRKFLRESQTRIRSMSLVHERLYQTEDLARIDFHLYIRDLVANLLRVYGSPPGVSVATMIDDLSLDLDTAIPCGLIINELVSNALKYAFPKDGAGTISIALQAQGADKLVLAVEDDGIGLAKEIDPKKAESLGLRLVYLLTNQLGGNCYLERTPGTRFRIVFDRY